MFSSPGPTLRELAVQALSSIERGYDLLAPDFDATPYRTPDRLLASFTRAVAPFGPFRSGLDVCCGTGAGIGVLRRLCAERVTGVDFSAGMLSVARDAAAGAPPQDGDGERTGGTTAAERAGTEPPPAGEEPDTGGGTGPAVGFVRADARALPFAPAFDLAVSFGAFGHFLPEERPTLFAGVHRALRPGGIFAFPMPAPPPVGSRAYWTLWGFDAAMRVRNLLWHPTFVMYYRTFPLTPVVEDLSRAGFAVELHPLADLGHRADGSPNCRLVVARRKE
jgi:SAM-dependent methyltransferase